MPLLQALCTQIEHLERMETLVGVQSHLFVKVSFWVAPQQVFALPPDTAKRLDAEGPLLENVSGRNVVMLAKQAEYCLMLLLVDLFCL